MQSFHPGLIKAGQYKKESSIQELLVEIQDQLQHIKITQYQATDRINRMDNRLSRIEKTLQQMQRVDMLGTTEKAPASISSSDG